MACLYAASAFSGWLSFSIGFGEADGCAVVGWLQLQCLLELSHGFGRFTRVRGKGAQTDVTVCPCISERDGVATCLSRWLDVLQVDGWRCRRTAKIRPDLPGAAP